LKRDQFKFKLGKFRNARGTGGRAREGTADKDEIFRRL